MTRLGLGQPSQLPVVAYIGLALCECGHPMVEHAEGYICTHKLDDPEDGWYGTCSCVLELGERGGR